MEITINVDGLDRIANLLAAVGDKAPTAIARALNHTGAKAKTQVIRAVTKQTGLKRGVIVRAIKPSLASAGSLAYALRSQGGDIRVKYFAPKETRPGVVAKPRGKSTLYAGAFMKGGRFPHRKAITRALTGGGVYQRIGGARFPVRQARSGVFIPEEMVEGESRRAFLAVADRDLVNRLAHELYRILG